MSSTISEFGPGDGVAFMLNGSGPAVQLLVSLYSLRRIYPDVPVCMLAGDDTARAHCEMFLGAAFLTGLNYVKSWTAPKGRGKGHIHDLSPFERTVFLDADTIVCGKINELLPQAGTEEVRLTQFAGWHSNGRRIKGRTEQYRKIMPQEVAVMHAHAYPAINTGTFGFTSLSTRYFKELKEICAVFAPFMADELAAQLIFVKYPHMILPDAWNWSPKFSQPNDDKRIVHFHGKQHVRPDKSGGHLLWLPLFRELWQANVANVREWGPKADRHLARWMKDHAAELEG
jgi:hypothetical protein